MLGEPGDVLSFVEKGAICHGMNKVGSQNPLQRRGIARMQPLPFESQKLLLVRRNAASGLANT